MNETYVDAPPDAVFDVLADAFSYGHWVVGSSRTRGADADWPAPGSSFRHVQGFWGIGLSDDTKVVASTRPRTMLLEARVRPFAVNKVELRLLPSGPGTNVVMVEYPTGGLARLLPKRLMDAALWLRNVEALRRLRKLAEEGPTDGSSG